MPTAKKNDKGLKGNGIEFEEDLLDEFDYEIAEAIVTSERIALDWVEGGETFHVVATSRDGGTTYRGRFGCPQPEKGWDMEITRYTAKNKSELLLAKWIQPELSNAGLTIIRLQPAK